MSTSDTRAEASRRTIREAFDARKAGTGAIADVPRATRSRPGRTRARSEDTVIVLRDGRGVANDDLWSRVEPR